jgi:hypothetical protein
MAAEGNGRIQLAVAVVTVVGGIAVAFIANYDKIFPPPPPAPHGLEVKPVADAPAPVVQGNQASTAATTNTVPAPATDGTPVNRAATGMTTQLTIANIAGQWDDENDAYHYVITQDAASFTYAATENGADRGTGKGTVIGQKLFYTFQNGSLTGQCSATVIADGNRIGGSCRTNSGDSFSFNLRRAV